MLPEGAIDLVFVCTPAAANLGLLRRVAVSLLKRMPGRESLRTKMIFAAGQLDYMNQMLSQMPRVLDA